MFKNVVLPDGKKEFGAPMTYEEARAIANKTPTVITKDLLFDFFHFKLDPTQTPAAIDVFLNGRRVLIGIYEMQGNRLKFHFTKTPHRPTTFALSPDDDADNRVMVLERLEVAGNVSKSTTRPGASPEATPAPRTTAAETNDAKTSRNAIRIRVVGPDGEPVAGASVRFGAAAKRQGKTISGEYISDAIGWATVALPEDVAAVHLTAGKGGYLDVSRGWDHAWLAAGNKLPQSVAITLLRSSSARRREY